MGEVTQMFDVNASQIRYYEREFEILQPKKNKKGNRLFSPDDVENLRIIFSLVKDKGYTLQGAKDHLRSNKDEVKENQKTIDSLNNEIILLEELVEMREREVDLLMSDFDRLEEIDKIERILKEDK
jgi:DNA-binding transcriptional MerR regulator